MSDGVVPPPPAQERDPGPRKSLTVELDPKTDIANQFRRLLIWSFVAVGALLLAGIAMAVRTDAANRVVVEAVINRNLGMVFGFLTLFFGVMMTWFGIASSYQASAQVGQQGGPSASVAIASSSPGMFFAVLGTVMICLSIEKEISYDATGQPGLFLSVADAKQIHDSLEVASKSLQSPERNQQQSSPEGATKSDEGSSPTPKTVDAGAQATNPAPTPSTPGQQAIKDVQAKLDSLTGESGVHVHIHVRGIVK